MDNPVSLISIVCPTIVGREHWLERCHESYRQTCELFEWIQIHDRPTCGVAWNDGFAQASGDYIHLTADDIEATPGWWETGINWVNRGFVPAARVVNGDGTLQSCGDTCRETPTGTPTMMARVPFLSREQANTVFPIIETHYMTDAWITTKAAQHGWPTVVVRDFCFIHHLASEGRLDTLEHDRKAFSERMRTLA